MNLTPIALFFLVLVPNLSWGSGNSSRTCFQIEAHLPEFMRALAHASLTHQELLTATSFACIELLDYESVQPGPLRDHARFAQKNWDIPVVGRLSIKIAEALSGTKSLSLSDLREDFAQKLKAIRTIKNRYERINQTYKLVTQYQGQYDRKSILPILSTNPKDTLNRSSETSFGGVCRQFAELLKWSLNQVNHYESENRGERFSADIATSWDHMWVRVTLPSENGEGFSDETIDLDTTDFPMAYVPLRSRTPLSDQDRQTLDQQCGRIHECLSEDENNR